jgi:hypothetical protein
MKPGSIFSQPFPCTTSLKSKAKTSLFFGVFVFLFLLVFKPFELDGLPWKRFLGVASIYGLTTFAAIFFVSVVSQKIAPSFFTERLWTNGKEIGKVAFTAMIIGLTNYLVSPLMVDTKLTVRDAIWFQGVTLAVGLLPITLYILVRQNQLLKKYRQKAEVLEQKLQEKQQLQVSYPDEAMADPGVITIEGDYQNERIAIPANQLYMVQSANNYVKIYFEQKGRVSYSIIRLTMKKVEDSLAAHSMFFRCHRTYIINLDKIKHVEGNAQGYKVSMDGIEESIPISRNFSAEFADKLLAIRKNK